MCRQYTAAEAERMGLVNCVVPFERLEDTCVEWAETMMERSPLALRMIKAGLNAELDGQAGIQELAGDATMLYYFLDEAQEGGKAFWKNANLISKNTPNCLKYQLINQPQPYSQCAIISILFQEHSISNNQLEHRVEFIQKDNHGL